MLRVPSAVQTLAWPHFVHTCLFPDPLPSREAKNNEVVPIDVMRQMSWWCHVTVARVAVMSCHVTSLHGGRSRSSRSSMYGDIHMFVDLDLDFYYRKLACPETCRRLFYSARTTSLFTSCTTSSSGLTPTTTRVSESLLKQQLPHHASSHCLDLWSDKKWPFAHP